ncbi:Outer membrane porin protein [Paraburkholderia domus]|uniref:Outer membrane porin protein n=1 Tax=Paraburkholderia domus TaxID=2793075 RepID=A0A9N8QV61_9BURK|nr:porin [Paraburkholderia domus]MBK5048344.1 porin [Burkholderia sp. R-70006]MBK5060573.1 porin [Burkholderia sp. R-70199]MBK5085597.1 porin [Burkholderia sp. R-69927]MBK5121920.1 porin [Burkholderia sp. R-69980]MBK5164636.1 porin [Burkholderia sp. R-70211]MBK5181926.1 porin [Burkholderia sp. R-69749]MCI0147902.1 porin [Paraburkholderia sediminicola]
MKKISAAVAAFAGLAATAANAQSSVTLYGLIDAGVMYTNNVKKGGSQGALVQATSGNINGSRFGLRGGEDLGGRMKAIFVLEDGYNVQNGKLGQNNRMFGRQAFAGLSSTQFGTLTLGRQYDSLVDFVAPLSGTAGTFGDTGFAHPFDNDNLNHSVRMSNAIKYTSVNYGGFTFGGLYAFSNNTDFAVNRAYSAGVSYSNGPFKAAAGYLQINGSNSTTNTGGAVDLAESAANGTGGFQLGADVQRTAGAALSYGFGPVTTGFVYTHSQFQNTASFGATHGSMRFDNFEVNGKYAVTPALSLGASYTYTNAHVSGTSTFGSDPKWNQVNVQAVYALSLRTDVYAEAMYQHVSGQGYTAFINTAGGASSTGNQVVGTVGLRTRF